jgi:hypothetical protein
MKKSRNDFFWPSFTDLMTSLFFIMLVLFVLKKIELEKQIKVAKNKVKIIETVEANLKPLKTDNELFTYEEDFNRFKLAFNVKFKANKHRILLDTDLENPIQTRAKIKNAGLKLKQVIDQLKKNKDNDSTLSNVSYIIVIAGYASKDLNTKTMVHNYNLSYLRALNLWAYWKYNVGVDFESPEYKGLIDLQIAGNGWGGVGRSEQETENQRFLIQIFPKIGEIK